MELTLKVWRQRNANDPGRFATYQAANLIPDMSFLEMLDEVNEGLIKKGEEPIAFDHDCREGICGTCSMVINGIAHGGFKGTTACQLHMRKFKDGDEIYIEPEANPPIVFDGKADDVFEAIIKKKYRAIPFFDPQLVTAWRFYVISDGPLPRRPGPRRLS